VLGIALLAVFATSARATQLLIGGNVGSSMLFDKSDGPSGAIDISGAFLGGVSFFDPSFTTFLDINDGGTFSWSGNGLNSDTSAGGLAAGSFLGGGTLSMTGTVTSSFVPAFTGVALQGTMSAFQLNENVGADDFLDSLNAVFTPTGGWLFDNGHVVNPYTFSITFIGAQQLGGGVEDFQDDIQFTTSSTFQMVEIPEPTTLAILAGLGLMLVQKRR
jgi:hypothetical protein